MVEERESANTGLNRRQFMRRAGVTAAGVAVAAAGADALFESSTAGKASSLSRLDPEGLHKPDPILEENILTGEILVIGNGRLKIDSAQSATTEVELAPNAYIDREGPASLSAYGPGDEIVVLGEKQGDTFIAVGIAPLFRTLEATVSSIEGSLIKTSKGKVLLTSRTVPKEWVAEGGIRVEARPLTDLKAGNEIKVLGLVNQKSQVMNASVIGVVTPSGSS
jgi:hypothetical protein